MPALLRGVLREMVMVDSKIWGKPGALFDATREIETSGAALTDPVCSRVLKCIERGKDPRDAGASWSAIGITLLGLGRVDEAVAAFREGLSSGDDRDAIEVIDAGEQGEAFQRREATRSRKEVVRRAAPSRDAVSARSKVEVVGTKKKAAAGTKKKAAAGTKKKAAAGVEKKAAAGTKKKVLKTTNAPSGRKRGISAQASGKSSSSRKAAGPARRSGA